MAIASTLVGITHFLLMIAAALIGIGIIIGFHELGHFLFCKLFKIRTPSFSIGFGPKIISKKIGDTEFSLSAIPVGGYVEIAGSHEVGQGEQKEAFSTDEHSFAKKPWYQKMLVMIGGIAFNILFAYIALSLLFMVGGSNSPLLLNFAQPTPVAAHIIPGSAAEQAGLKANDFYLRGIEITEASKTITIPATIPQATQATSQETLQQILTAIKEHPDAPATLHIARHVPDTGINGTDLESGDLESVTVPVIIGSKEIAGKKIGILGIEFHRAPLQPEPFFQAIKDGIALTHLHIINTYEGFIHIFSKRDTSGVGGPIMIISAIGQAFSKGFGFFLLLLSIISINLAILNLIPLPIFDGGQMLYYTIEAVIGRPISVKIREYIHIANWILLALLMLYLSFKDTSRIVKPHWHHVSKLFSKKTDTGSHANGSEK